MICKLSVGAILMALVIHTGARGENAWPLPPDAGPNINPVVLVNAADVWTTVFVTDDGIRTTNLKLDGLPTNSYFVQLDMSPTARGNGMVGIGRLSYVREDGEGTGQEFPLQGRFRAAITRNTNVTLHTDGSFEQATQYSHDHTVRLRGGGGTRLTALLSGQVNDQPFVPDWSFAPEAATALGLEAEGRVLVDGQFRALSGPLVAMFNYSDLLDIDEIDIRRSAPRRAAGIAPVVSFEESLPVAEARVRLGAQRAPGHYRLDASVPGRSRSFQFLIQNPLDTQPPSLDPVEMILDDRTLVEYYRYASPGIRYEKFYTYSVQQSVD